MRFVESSVQIISNWKSYPNIALALLGGYALAQGVGIGKGLVANRDTWVYNQYRLVNNPVVSQVPNDSLIRHQEIIQSFQQTIADLAQKEQLHTLVDIIDRESVNTAAIISAFDENSFAEFEVHRFEREAVTLAAQNRFDDIQKIIDPKLLANYYRRVDRVKKLYQEYDQRSLPWWGTAGTFSSLGLFVLLNRGLAIIPRSKEQSRHLNPIYPED
jgi:hypothetical protein